MRGELDPFLFPYRVDQNIALYIVANLLISILDSVHRTEQIFYYTPTKHFNSPKFSTPAHVDQKYFKGVTWERKRELTKLEVCVDQRFVGPILP